MLPRSDVSIFGCTWPLLNLKMGGDVLYLSKSHVFLSNFYSMFSPCKLLWQPMNLCSRDSLVSKEYFPICYLHVYRCCTHKTIHLTKKMQRNRQNVPEACGHLAHLRNRSIRHHCACAVSKLLNHQEDAAFIEKRTKIPWFIPFNVQKIHFSEGAIF